MANKEINYEIVKHIATLSEGKGGWTKEVNLIKWNGGDAKLDIRSWSEDKSKMGKGISLDYEEAQILLSSGIEDLDF